MSDVIRYWLSTEKQFSLAHAYVHPNQRSVVFFYKQNGTFFPCLPFADPTKKFVDGATCEL